MDIDAKDGVYVNKFKDTGNLFIVKNGKFIDGEAVDVFSYSMEWILENRKLVIVYMRDVEYMGEL
jgi:hypothetical protein